MDEFLTWSNETSFSTISTGLADETAVSVTSPTTSLVFSSVGDSSVLVAEIGGGDSHTMHELVSRHRANINPYH